MSGAFTSVLARKHPPQHIKWQIRSNHSQLGCAPCRSVLTTMTPALANLDGAHQSHNHKDSHAAATQVCTSHPRHETCQHALAGESTPRPGLLLARKMQAKPPSGQQYALPIIRAEFKSHHVDASPSAFPTHRANIYYSLQLSLVQGPRYVCIPKGALTSHMSICCADTVTEHDHKQSLSLVIRSSPFVNQSVIQRLADSCVYY